MLCPVLKVRFHQLQRYLEICVLQFIPIDFIRRHRPTQAEYQDRSYCFLATFRPLLQNASYDSLIIKLFRPHVTCDGWRKRIKPSPAASRDAAAHIIGHKKLQTTNLNSRSRRYRYIGWTFRTALSYRHWGLFWWSRRAPRSPTPTAFLCWGWPPQTFHLLLADDPPPPQSIV